MSESTARVIYSTYRRLNVVVNEDLFSHCSKSSTRVRVIHPDSIHKSAILNWEGLWPASKLSMGDIVSGH